MANPSKINKAKIPTDSSPKNYLAVKTVIKERIVLQEDLSKEILKEEKRLSLEKIAKKGYEHKDVSIFDEMRDFAKQEDMAGKRGMYAMQWMKNAITELYDISEELSVEEKYFRDSKRLVTTRGIKRPGEMYLFNYNPLTKSKLKYYDTFPLIFIIDEYKDGFLGMNLHYLPIELRERLFVNLLPYATGDTTKEETIDQTRLKITYDLLNKTSKLRYFRPCVKRYKYNRIDSRLLRIPSVDWMTAIYLPLDRFQKKNRKIVWRESRWDIAKRMKD